MHADLDYALVQVEGEHPERLILAAELVKDVMDRAGIEQFHNLGYAKGAALELLRFNHPFYSFDVPVVLGDHVTLDAGTGAVHTAPGHGQEDFVVGQKYGLKWPTRLAATACTCRIPNCLPASTCSRPTPPWSRC